MGTVVSWNGQSLSPALFVRLSFAVAATILVTSDHARDSAGMTYVYPVVSRRAGGVSIGINLNPNNACNWHCIYCQVPGLVRGGPPPVDLGLLARELDSLLNQVLEGDFMAARVPPDQRRLVDVAISGNGEPTSAPEFPAAVALAADALERRGLGDGVRLRLITNGSLVDRAYVRQGLERLGAAGGEAWFKVDAGTTAAMGRVNGVRPSVASVERRLRACAGLCATWVQTCIFAFDGRPPAEAEVAALLALLGRVADVIGGVHLYGLARPSAQAEAPRLTALPVAWLEKLAERMR
ncbi:MAG TPA: radical SAM protein, partial [Rhodocyclaceae bacterium]|nr:radical SAM protein [Rhodocyclaceae bacterium]